MRPGKAWIVIGSPSIVTSGPERRMLGSLTVGSRVRIEIEGEAVLSEKLTDAADGHAEDAFKPLPPGDAIWRRHLEGPYGCIEIEFAGNAAVVRV